MKRILTILCAAVLSAAVLMTTALAAAPENESLIVSAVVEGAETIALKAPASGELSPFTLRAGDVVEKGDTLLEVEPVKVYADIDGTVAAIHAAKGDSADAAVSRYGAAMEIEYQNRYVLQCSTRTGYNDTENRDLYTGTPVYLRSANEKHAADGVITSFDGSNFTVEVIGGDLVYTQDVRVYADKEYSSDRLLARAKLSIAPPYQVVASGTVADVAVKRGQKVKKGDYLFSYYPDVLSPERRGRADAGEVRAEQDLIITEVSVQQGASVQKGQALVSAIPVGAYQLCARVEEGDLPALRVGDVFSVRFEELGLQDLTATVVSVGAVGSEEETSRFSVYLAFDAPQLVRPGMHATVETKQKQ